MYTKVVGTAAVNNTNAYKTEKPTQTIYLILGMLQMDGLQQIHLLMGLQ